MEIQARFMTAFLNIALLIVGTAATLAAFGGKTWSEGPEPILARINLRGWISLLCLVLAFAVGTVKEVVTQREDTRKENTARQISSDAARKQAEQSAELEKTKLQLEALQKLDQSTQDRLGETKATLEDVRGNLGKAHDELDRQGDVNLVTALSTSDQRVTDVQFIIPFTSKGTKGTTFHDVFLPKDFSPACRKDTEVDVALWLESGGVQYFRYSSSDDKPSHEHFTDSPPKVDALFHATAELFGDDTDTMINVNLMRNLAGQRTTNLHAATFVIHVTRVQISCLTTLSTLRTLGIVQL